MDHGTDAYKKWLANLLADKVLIVKSGIRPLAIVRRLDEAAAGKLRSDDWYDFTAPCRGQSYLSTEKTTGKTQRVITLEFRQSEPAQGVYDQLTTLMGGFKLIADIRIHKIPRNNSASVTIAFPVPPSS